MNFYDGQTETERVIERLHGEEIKIVELKITSITPKPPRLNAYTGDIEMAVIERCQLSIVSAFSEDKNRNEIFRVNAADKAFVTQVAEPIAEHILPPNVTNARKFRVVARDGTIIIMTSEEVEETIRGKTETYLKAKLTIGLRTKHQPLEVLKAA